MRRSTAITSRSFLAGLWLFVGPAASAATMPPQDVATRRPETVISARQSALAILGDQVEAVTTLHFRALSDESTLSLAQTATQRLETVWRFYFATLGNLGPLRGPAEGRCDVFLFARPGLFRRFASALHEEGMEVRALHSAAENWIAFDASAVLDDRDFALLMGETARFLNDRLLSHAAPGASWWLREGLALYFMQSRVDKNGQFKPGGLRKGGAYIPDLTEEGRNLAVLPYVSNPRKAAKSARDLYEKGRHIPLETLLQAESSTDFGEIGPRHRAAVEAWILVHYLLHGHEGTLRPRLSSYIEKEEGGAAAVDLFRRTVTADLAGLEARMYVHVRRMK